MLVSDDDVKFCGGGRDDSRRLMICVSLLLLISRSSFWSPSMNIVLLCIDIFFTLKGYWLRENKNKFKKSRLSPDPVKRIVGEI